MQAAPLGRQQLAVHGLGHEHVVELDLVAPSHEEAVVERLTQAGLVASPERVEHVVEDEGVDPPAGGRDDGCDVTGLGREPVGACQQHVEHRHGERVAGARVGGR